MFLLFLLALPFLLVGAVLIGVFALLLPLLGFLISLPFRILGFALGALGWLIVLPFLVVGGAFVIGGILLAMLLGGGFLLLPLLPLALVAVGIVWLVRRGHRGAVHV